MKPFDTTPGRQVVLAPGDLFFGKAPKVAHTLLGSCIAITLWHRSTLQGGMCHYLLAARDEYAKNDKQARGYFGSDAIEYFLQQAHKRGLPPASFEVKMFGGGHMFEGAYQRSNVVNVASNNIEKGREMLRDAGFNLMTEDVGGIRYRKIFFDFSTGDVWVQYGKHDHACVSSPGK